MREWVVPPGEGWRPPAAQLPVRLPAPPVAQKTAISSSSTMHTPSLFPPLKKKTAAELQVQLVDLLLQDNNALTSALSTAAREEAELRRAVSRLERTLRHHTQKGCILSVGVPLSPAPGSLSLLSCLVF